ncbi:MAG: c-type cytochrome, partial [Maioricimonas sp. JB049]
GGKRSTRALLDAYSNLHASVQSDVVDVLFRRPDSARQLLNRIGAGTIDPKDVTALQLRSAAVHADADVDRLIRSLWGRITPGTTEEKLATMRRFKNDLRAGSGDIARGRILFAKHCGSCHQMFGEGNRIGPDLTTANRHDQEALLANIVDPSAVIRREYLSYTLATDDGRVLTGLLDEQDAAGVTLLTAKKQRIRVPRSDIETIRESPVSLMPERLLEAIGPQERRDLFAFLMQ